MKTVAEVAKEMFPTWIWDSSDDQCADMEKLAVEYAKEVLHEVWKGYDLALSPEDQKMMDNILERIEKQIG